MPHVGGQQRQLRLHVPLRRGYHRRSALTANPWRKSCVRGSRPVAVRTSARRNSARMAPPRTATAVAAAGVWTAMPEQRCCPARWAVAARPANLEQVLDLAGRYRPTERDEARLVELGFADRQRALRRVVVCDGQPRQLSASQPGGGQQHDREAHVVGTEWRIGGAGQRARGGQQLDDLVVSEDMWPDGLVDRRGTAARRERSSRARCVVDTSTGFARPACGPDACRRPSAAG